MKKISVVVPCYNDSSSIVQLRERLLKVFSEQLPQYEYEIIFVDDCSPDNTWSVIKNTCASDVKCKGVRNARNFGVIRNLFAAMKYGTGDAVFMVFGDLQDPPEYLPEFIKQWENGSQVVVGQRSNTYNKRLTRFARWLYYRLIKKLSNKQLLEGVNGFGLYDSSFIKILSDIEDIQPVLPGIITEYAQRVVFVPVHQEKGMRGTSGINFWNRYDIAMMSLTSYTKSLLRIVTFIGAIIGTLSLLLAFWILIHKLIAWDSFLLGLPILTVGMFFLGAVQLFFLGIIGEYVLSINNRSIKRPIVVIDETINFESGRES